MICHYVRRATAAPSLGSLARCEESCQLHEGALPAVRGRRDPPDPVRRRRPDRSCQLRSRGRRSPCGRRRWPALSGRRQRGLPPYGHRAPDGHAGRPRAGLRAGAGRSSARARTTPARPGPSRSSRWSTARPASSSRPRSRSCATSAATLEFFRTVCEAPIGMLMIQDLEWGGPGLPVSTIVRLFEELEPFRCIKVETVPAGSQVQRDHRGDRRAPQRLRRMGRAAAHRGARSGDPRRHAGRAALGDRRGRSPLPGR